MMQSPLASQFQHTAHEGEQKTRPSSISESAKEMCDSDGVGPDNPQAKEEGDKIVGQEEPSSENTAQASVLNAVLEIIESHQNKSKQLTGCRLNNVPTLSSESDEHLDYKTKIVRKENVDTKPCHSDHEKVGVNRKDPAASDCITAVTKKDIRPTNIGSPSLSLNHKAERKASASNISVSAQEIYENACLNPDSQHETDKVDIMEGQEVILEHDEASGSPESDVLMFDGCYIPPIPCQSNVHPGSKAIQESELEDSGNTKKRNGEESSSAGSDDGSTSSLGSNPRPSIAENILREDFTRRKFKRFQSCLDSYEAGVQKFQGWMIEKLLWPIVKHAAFHPYMHIVVTITISLGIVLIAAFTGSIVLETRTYIFAVPQDSYTISQLNWIEASFANDRVTQFIIHDNGNNILTYEATDRVFELIEQIPEATDYAKICADASNCRILSPTNMWSNRSEFFALVANESDPLIRDDLVRLALSSPTFADGSSFSRSSIFGRPETNHRTVTSGGLATSELVSSTSFRVSFSITGVEVSKDAWEFERSLGAIVTNLQEEWENDGLSLTIEIYNNRIEGDELEDPIYNDLPLVGAAFLIMGAFTSVVFARFNRDGAGRCCIESSSLLGVGATVTVLLSTLTGYGICLLSGYPITTLTQMLPFVLVGIGLDDAIILFGSLQQTRKDLPMETRLRKMTRGVGPSVVLTTFTDCMAFALGAAFTSVPGIKWFCFYAVVCILVDFLYQITFFIAILALDLRRQSADRYDCLVCFKSKLSGRGMKELNEQTTDDELNSESLSYDEESESFREKVIKGYSEFLFKTPTKIAVLLAFTTFFIYMAISASKVQVSFDLSDYMLEGSPIIAFINADTAYFAAVGGGLPAYFYFQGLNQSSLGVQMQMLEFMNDIVDTEFIDEFPTAVWMNDLDALVNNHTMLSALSFPEQLDAFLAIEPNPTLYGPNILRGKNGSILASRIQANINVETYDTARLIAMLKRQREVTLAQPLNQSPHDGNGVERMFLFYAEFPTYFHFMTISKELVVALVVEIAAVGLVSSFFFPRIMGTLLSVLAVTMITVDLVGVIPLAGFTLNTATMLLLIMAVGLVVDYCLHIIDSFLQVSPEHCNNRDQRMEKALLDIGGSVLLGGFSTFLGICALAFSSGQLFWSFFVMFISMVVLGVAHGLIFLPVMFTLVGPKTPKAPVRKRSTVLRNRQSMLSRPNGRMRSTSFQASQQIESYP